MEENFDTYGLDSVTVARSIRYSAVKQGFNVNMTQIHKVLYIIYGIVLVEKKKRLTAEIPAAWPYGPVFPRVHTRVKLYDEITAKEYDELNAQYPEIIKTLDESVMKYGRYSAAKLSAWSHKQGSPWSRVASVDDNSWNKKLRDEDIYSYFFNWVKVKPSEINQSV